MVYMIPLSEPDIGAVDIDSVVRVLKSGQISGTTQVVKEFEQAFARYIGREYTVAVSNGTAALHLALRVLGVSSSTAVVIPAFSGIYIPNSVTYCGARLLLVDSESESWGMSPTGLDAMLTDGYVPKIKAVVVMHAYGTPCQVEKISELCESHRVSLVEDCAEAHGAIRAGRKVGQFGSIGCFSFYANKIMTTGEGGALVMDDRQVYKRALSLRSHAFGEGHRKFIHSDLGYNYRMSGLQAALGLAQLDKIEDYIEHRRGLAQLYRRELEKHACLTVQPDTPSNGRSVYWYFSILSEKRESLSNYLETRGVESRPFFEAVHRQPLYAKAFRDIRAIFPTAEYLADRGLNLPLGNTTTKKQVSEVCNKIRNFISRNPALPQ